jgi:FKBP-type peptidyl-prolyl cis-trans isomerase FkpA
MNKTAGIATIIIVIVILIIWYMPRATKPIAKLPDMTGNQGDSMQNSSVVKQTAKQDVATEDITIGTGTEVKDGMKVSVQYRGVLATGEEFDSSYSRNNTPLEFVVGGGQMIPGFDMGVRGMKVGGKRKITIPSNLGYGDRSVGKIPANSTLIFEVELERAE